MCSDGDIGRIGKILIGSMLLVTRRYRYTPLVYDENNSWGTKISTHTNNKISVVLFEYVILAEQLVNCKILLVYFIAMPLVTWLIVACHIDTYH
jgi:hypothetical protein